MVHDSTSVVSFSSGCSRYFNTRDAKTVFHGERVPVFVKNFTSVSLTVECVYIQQHGALPLVGGPLQLGEGVDSGSGSRELQRGEQFALAQ